MALPMDQIAATTLKNYRKSLTDGIFNKHPLLYHLKDKKRVRMLSGGEQIVEPIIHTFGDTPAADGGTITTGSYGEWDDIAITPVETATAAIFDWKTIAATIAISGLQELKNSGPEQMINLLEAKIFQAEETLSQNLSTMLWKSTAPGTDVTGVGVLVGDHTSTITEVGGIDCAAADGSGDFWRSVVVDATNGGAFTDWANYDIRKAIRNAYNTASKGGPDRVDLVVVSQALFEQYEEDLMQSVRRTNTKFADAGFQNLEVQGVPMVWDWMNTDNTVYGINSKYLGLVGHKNRWFKNSKFTNSLESAHATNGGVASVVDARYSIITAALELTTRNRRRHFRINGITPRA